MHARALHIISSPIGRIDRYTEAKLGELKGLGGKYVQSSDIDMS
jgi:hypothetical protein